MLHMQAWTGMHSTTNAAVAAITPDHHDWNVHYGTGVSWAALAVALDSMSMQ